METMDTNSKSPISSTSSPSDHQVASRNTTTATTTKSNPFSIDYILSSSAVAKSSQDDFNPDPNSQDHLNMMNNQQRAQLMVAAATVAASQPNNDLDLTAHLHQQQDQASMAMSQIKAGQQTNPNFLYFMAYMLLQQQQQQQQQQQSDLRQRQQQIAANQEKANQQLSGSTSNINNVARQPVDLASSPLDSLSILARLTGNSATGAQLTQNHQLAEQLGKHIRMPNQTNRHHPYQQAFQQTIDNNRPPYPPLTNLTHLPIFSTRGTNIHNRASPNPLNLLNHQRAHHNHNHHLNPLMNNHKSNHLLSKFSQSSNSSGSSGSSSSHQFINKNNNHLTGENTHTSSNGDKLDNLKPAHSYIGLIAMCILSSPEKRMVLNDIYQFILDNYPYYRNRGSGWRNSVRHNLSLNECFQKAARAANGKGHYWTIHPANMEDFMMGDFRRRRAQRKVRRWNNMDVPSDESDDESIEDATKPPLPEHFKRSLEMHRQIELKYQESAKATQAALAAVVGQPVLNLPPHHLPHPPTLPLPPPSAVAPHSSGPCSPALFRKK